jgi:hypothetical protein
MSTETFSGARSIFKLQGIPVGFAGGVSGEEVVDYEPVDVLGLIEVREHVPVAYRCSLTAQVFRVINSPLKRFGPTNLEVFPKEDNILTTGELTAIIEDRLNPGVIPAQFEGVKSSGHSFDVSARGLVSENISFVAIRLKDESTL